MVLIKLRGDKGTRKELLDFVEVHYPSYFTILEKYLVKLT